MSKLPILFVIFNRPLITCEAFKPIREYQPERLYIAADGPRPYKKGEKENCDATRASVLSMIDWKCEVKTLFRDENLGCADGVNGAINWFFEKENFGVIIEDDVVLHSDFFKLCEELGTRYEDTNSVMQIAAMYPSNTAVIQESYGFSTTMQCWGWATWKRAWMHMDMTMRRYPKINFWKYLRTFGLFYGWMNCYYYWGDIYKKLRRKEKVTTWARRWAFNIFASDGLIIVPRVNMMKNIGCTGIDGTHYNDGDEDLYINLKTQGLEWPIIHPIEIKPNKKIAKIERKDFRYVRWHGFKKKIKNRFHYK